MYGVYRGLGWLLLVQAQIAAEQETARDGLMSELMEVSVKRAGEQEKYHRR